jgi:NTE family protein
MPGPITEADGVFQGGGVKGLALVGGLLAFERGDDEVKIERWVNVAGTSAGAIVAAFLAAGSTPQELDVLLRKMPYRKFEDWGPGGAIIGGGLNLLRHHGLAHGKFFHDWLDKELGGKTFADVKRAAAEPRDKTGDEYRLRLIATDVTNREMLVLPADLDKYRHPGTREPIDPDTTKIADAVRMSMSIPYFFQPVLLERIDTGKLSTIVDGGVLSNFPVWLFDVYDSEPTRPTFGFHLTGGKGVGGALGHIIDGLGWPVRLGTDIFHTSTEAWDKRFMSHSTVVRTCSIPAGDVGTTDFSIDEQGQQKLIRSGETAAAAFLAEFQVESYINTFGKKLVATG